MCGIAGIIDTRGYREFDRAIIARMTDQLAHRGPDGHGFHLEPGFAFGHRRLAIIDIAGGAQPFVSATGKTVITFNGEIYNYKRLANAVTSDGRPLKTNSDTEILAELIDRRGADALPDLQGMFAFASFSPRDETFILARDRLGEKPLYYHLTADGLLVFASEIDALIASGLVTTILDDTAVADYLFYGYVPDPKTIYRGIYKLPPAHYMSFRRGQPVTLPRQWWSVTMRPDMSMTYEQALDELLPMIDRAVGDQLVADVPVASFLSGGIDSSTIVSSMASQGDSAITTCSMGFDDPRFDERAPARTVASLYGTDHHEQVVSLEATSLIPLIASVFGEPFADTSALPTLLLCALAREHATVALSGDGGDEIFAGYGRYHGVLQESRLRRVLPGFARKNIVGLIGDLYPAMPWAPRQLRLRTALQAIGEEQASGYARAVSAVLPDQTRTMLTPALRDYRPQTVIEAAIAGANTDDPVLQAQAADLATWLPGRMLVKVDRASMASSLEVRPPLLDHRLVEWAATLPRSFKMKDGTSKRILKEALADHLPETILHRKKQGFGTPVDAWFSARDGQLLRQIRNTSAWKDSGYFDVDRVLKLADKHEKGRERHGQALWSVLLFDAFLTRAPFDCDKLATAVMSAKTSSGAGNVA